MKRVFSIIIAGSGPGFGSGHMRRMSELHRRLKRDGEHSEFFLLENSLDGAPEPNIRPGSSDRGAGRLLSEWIGELEGRFAGDASVVLVLDARDLDPAIFPCPVIALDNRSDNREEILRGQGPGAGPPTVRFHDTLPHPRADLNQVMENCLVSEDIIARRREIAGVPTRNPGRALVYVGETGMETRLDLIMNSLLTRGAFTEVLRVGGRKPGIPGIRHAVLLEGAEYVLELARSDVVFSYFGMTILEAWYLGKRPVLYSIHSPVHHELSLDLAARTWVPYLSTEIGDDWEPEKWSLERWDTEQIAAASRYTGPGPSGHGFDILRELVAAPGRP